MDKRLDDLAFRIQRQRQERQAREYPNIQTAPTTRVKLGAKYAKIDVSTCGQWAGAYMVDQDGTIYGIKGYGVIHKGHRYGTLDTIRDWDWSGYTAVKIAP